MDTRFAESPEVHDAIQGPAVLCAFPAWQPYAESKKDGSPVRWAAGTSRVPCCLAKPPISQRIRYAVLE